MDQRSFDITVTGVNDAPVLGISGSLSTAAGTPLLLSATNAVTDPDAGSTIMKAVLKVLHGTLNPVAVTPGLTVTAKTRRY